MKNVRLLAALLLFVGVAPVFGMMQLEDAPVVTGALGASPAYFDECPVIKPGPQSAQLRAYLQAQKADQQKLQQQADYEYFLKWQQEQQRGQQPEAGFVSSAVAGGKQVVGDLFLNALKEEMSNRGIDPATQAAIVYGMKKAMRPVEKAVKGAAASGYSALKGAAQRLWGGQAPGYNLYPTDDRDIPLVPIGDHDYFCPQDYTGEL